MVVSSSGMLIGMCRAAATALERELQQLAVQQAMLKLTYMQVTLLLRVYLVVGVFLLTLRASLRPPSHPSCCNKMLARRTCS